ncbi:MAG: glycosyltransferase family 4 protein [Myxococcales bacterium]|nr:glycosyltransferase family 4 protein [Myxococcales bacterium]MDH3485131.1 glycosyltransferase family 4 protein [Myxococcales bacterium]
MSRQPRLLALAAYPERSAATRFRLTQMLPYLRARGWNVHFMPFVEDDFFSGFYAKGNRLNKAKYLASRSLHRLASAAVTSGLDAVFIQREAALIGPAYTEFILHSLKRLPIVFDFDDAIWHYDLPRSRHPIAARVLKDPNKCWYTMRQAELVIAGSIYLAGHARAVNSKVEVVPTVVPSATWTPLPVRLDGAFRRQSAPRIGWVGSHSTAHQLELVEPALRQLRADGYEFELHVVGAGDDFALDTAEVQSRPWRLDEEIQEFQRIDIGLAPMHSGPVYEGKCGFKQIQYMAVGVPFVSSWVGGARDFVVDGENGLVAHDAQDWYRHLKALLESQELRRRLSRNGRRLVEREYCLERQGPRVAQCFEETLGHARAS